MVTFGVALSIALAGPAEAGECQTAGHAGVEVCPTNQVVDPADPPQVSGASFTRTGLPFTGSDVAGLAAIGGVAIGTGVVLVTGTRRRRAEA